MTLDLATARTRLTEGYYNAQSKTVANPGGMGADGHKENLPDALQAVGLVGTAAAASESTATAGAATATAAAGTASTAAGTATTQAGIATTKAAAAAASAAAAAGAVNGVAVSGDDTMPGDLETKLLFGPGLIGTTQNGGGAETRTAAVDPNLVLASPTVSTLLTVAAGMQSGSVPWGDVSGDVVIEASDPPHIYCAIVGDTTFLVAGGTVPGHAHDHLIHWTMGGAGGYAVTVLPPNLLLNTDDFSTTWTAASGNTVSVNDTVAPDGTTTADTITWTTTADTRRQDVSVANDSASYTAVIFFKETAGAFAALQMAFTGGTTKDSYARVNLETGDVVATGGGAGTATVTSVAAAHGYWKVTISNANNGLGNTVLRVSVQKVASDSSQLTGALTVWRGNLFAGASELGTQKVGATRAGQVVVQGTATDFPAMAAAATGDLAISIEPDGRIVTQDHTVEEL